MMFLFQAEITVKQIEGRITIRGGNNRANSSGLEQD
jgi:hypothetical protein